MIVQTICDFGPMTERQWAEKSGIQLQTIELWRKQLAEAKLIEPAGTTETHNGRPGKRPTLWKWRTMP